MIASYPEQRGRDDPGKDEGPRQRMRITHDHSWHMLVPWCWLLCVRAVDRSGNQHNQDLHGVTHLTR